MNENICAICHLEVTDSYILIGDKHYHLECFVDKVRTEGTDNELYAALCEILTIHGF